MWNFEEWYFNLKLRFLKIPFNLEAQYLKFLDQYNQTLNAGTKKVIDFDVLVRQLEEKQRRQEEGMIQETPLTEYINKLSQEKVFFLDF